MSSAPPRAIGVFNLVKVISVGRTWSALQTKSVTSMDTLVELANEACKVAVFEMLG